MNAAVAWQQQHIDGKMMKLIRAEFSYFFRGCSSTPLAPNAKRWRQKQQQSILHLSPAGSYRRKYRQRDARETDEAAAGPPMFRHFVPFFISLLLLLLLLAAAAFFARVLWLPPLEQSEAPSPKWRGRRRLNHRSIVWSQAVAVWEAHYWQYLVSSTARRRKARRPTEESTFRDCSVSVTLLTQSVGRTHGTTVWSGRRGLAFLSRRNHASHGCHRCNVCCRLIQAVVEPL